MMKKSFQLLIVLVIFIQIIPISNNSASLNSSIRDYWPTTNWKTINPETQGMDSSLLTQMKDVIIDNDFPLDSLVVVRNGYIIVEEYHSPVYHEYTPHLLFSVTKSVTSALIGIAIDQGFIEDVDQKVIDFFPNKTILNLDPRKQQMTIRHLLTMTSGIAWEGPDDMVHTWGEAVLSGNPIEFILNQPMESDPGTKWYYNGGCSHLLSAILTQVTGNSTLDFVKDYRRHPIIFIIYGSIFVYL